MMRISINIIQNAMEWSFNINIDIVRYDFSFFTLTLKIKFIKK